MSPAREILEEHLRRIGLTSPIDAAQLVQVTMLRQWVNTLEAVMIDEEVPAAVRGRIMRGVIYGSAPQQAEAVLREKMTVQLRDVLMSRPPLPLQFP